MSPLSRIHANAKLVLGVPLTAIAMRKKGITDSLYRDPHWTNHGVLLPKN